MPHSDADLWSCPKCGEKFTTSNIWHSCGQHTLEALFQRRERIVWQTYLALQRIALDVAPFHVIVQKTRICFQLRTRCAGGTPFKSYFRFHFLARQPIEHSRIVRVDTYAKDQHDHSVKLFSPKDVDGQIREWLAISTEYGEQTGRG